MFSARVGSSIGLNLDVVRPLVRTVPELGIRKANRGRTIRSKTVTTKSVMYVPNKEHLSAS
jgi:hypothetical protein